MIRNEYETGLNLSAARACIAFCIPVTFLINSLNYTLQFRIRRVSKLQFMQKFARTKINCSIVSLFCESINAYGFDDCVHIFQKSHQSTHQTPERRMAKLSQLYISLGKM